MEDLTKKVKEALKTRNPEVYLRDNLGISRAEARKVIARFHKIEKRNFVYTGFAAGFLSVVLLGTGLVFSNNKPSEKPAVQTAEKQTVEDIISRHAYIDKIVNPEGEGDIYVIGQKHYTLPFDRKGNTKHNDPISTKDTAEVQCDNFFLIKDLILEKRLKFFIGESNKVKDYKVSQENLEKGRIYGPKIMNSRKKEALKFFENNPHAIAYEVLKHFLPDKFHLKLIGEGSVKEKRDLLRKKMRARVNLYGQRHNINENLDIGEVAKHDPVLLELVKEDCYLNSEVNKWYLDESQRLADELGHKNFAIGIGIRHLRGMMEIYKGKRRLILIRPKSYSQNINDFPLDEFEDFKKFYGF